MGNVTKENELPLQEAHLVQASAMDDRTLLVSFSNGLAALIDSEEIKNLVTSSKAKTATTDDVSE